MVRGSGGRGEIFLCGNSVASVSVKELKNGIYFVEVVTDKANLMDKILIFR